MTGRVVAGLLLLAGLIGSPSAEATSPGTNGSILFQAESSAAVFSLQLVTPDGVLSRALPFSGSTPAWSPDGSRIVCAVRDIMNRVQLISVALDGSDATTLANGDLAFPAWSPDGTKMAFGSFGDGGWDIWVMNADGSGARVVAPSPFEDVFPTWSPDSTRIAFQSNRDGDREIYVVNAEGTNLHNVTNRHSAEDEAPDWSPDGTKLVFDSFTNSTGDNIYTIRPDGSALKPVTSDNGNTQASWSPDGRQIVFLKTSPRLQVFTMNADGTELTQITSYDGEVFRPTWQSLTPGRVTHTTVTAGTASVVYGTDTSFTATVAGAGPTPTGPIEFSIDGEGDGAPRSLDSHGSATYSPDFLLDVGDVVTATYGGDARWGWSTADAPLQVRPAATTTTLTTTPNPVAVGGVVTATVTVHNASTDIPPFGTVQFSIDGSAIGPPLILDERGSVSSSLQADVAPGEYRITAAYEDDTASTPDFVPSQDTAIQRVTLTSTPPQAPSTPTPAPVPMPLPAPSPLVTQRDLIAFQGKLVHALRAHGLVALRERRGEFMAKAPGTLVQQVLRGRTLVAAGRHTYRTAGVSRFELKLTRAGRHLLRTAKHADLEVTTTFAPAQGASVATSTRMTVRRRSPTLSLRIGGGAVDATV